MKEEIVSQKGWNKERIIMSLREEGCRITKQRLLILETILEEDCSSCKEIFYKVQQKDRNVGPATVYRMINVLEKIGAINRKNMYRIAKTVPEETAAGCVVHLSDDTICHLPPQTWKQVMQVGMKNMGYIDRQKIESIEVNENLSQQSKMAGISQNAEL